MDDFGRLFGKELAMAFGGLFMFGILFAWLVNYIQKRTKHYTAELVVIGSLVTVLVSGFIIGWAKMAVVLILFAASGSPMIVGSWITNALDEQHAKRIMMEKMDD